MADGATTPPIEIRALSRFDMVAVEAMFRQAYETVDWELPPYDGDHCWLKLIDASRKGMVAVAVCDGKLVGVLALQLAAWPWNPAAQFLENEHFFVDVNYRRRGVARKLLDTAKTIADNAHMPLRITMTFGTDPEKLGRWGKINGLKVLGSNFLYPVK